MRKAYHVGLTAVMGGDLFKPAALDKTLLM